MGNPEVRRIVEQSVQENLTEYLELHPDVLDSILSKSLNALKVPDSCNNYTFVLKGKNILYPIYCSCKMDSLGFFLVCSAAVCDKLLSLQASLAAKRARELVRSKSVLKSSSLPGKLADCASTNPEESGESTFILAMCNVLGFKFQSGLGLLHTCFFAHTSWL